MEQKETWLVNKKRWKNKRPEELSEFLKQALKENKLGSLLQ